MSNSIDKSKTNFSLKKYVLAIVLVVIVALIVVLIISFTGDDNNGIYDTPVIPDLDGDGINDDDNDSAIDTPVIPDSDGDGINDDDDPFPDDPSRWALISLALAKDTNDLNWSLFINDIDGPRNISKSDIFITIIDSDQIVRVDMLQLSIMSPDIYCQGIMFIDNRAPPTLDVTDRFKIDKALYQDGSMIQLSFEDGTDLGSFTLNP